MDPPAPRGHTLWQRAVKCRDLITDNVEEDVTKSMMGTLPRSQTNGLGFDPRRIVYSTVPNNDSMVDPVVELFALCGVERFPVGGEGGEVQSVRGWGSGSLRRFGFTWAVWDTPMKVQTVDAVLDRFWVDRPDGFNRKETSATVRADLCAGWADRMVPLGVFAAFGSVPYQPTMSNDPTRGLASEPLWNRP